MDGIILINKPSGMTSHDVVNKLRKILKTKKVGHCGTLDPDATGVLVVCVNKATKVLQMCIRDRINAAQENGIKIPEEMEVVGMLNTSYSIMCKPTLSSLNVPVYDMGALAVRLLTKFLHDEKIESKEIAVRHMFIKRNSNNE